MLPMTRISVAHRPDISAGADRVIRVARTVLAETRGQAHVAISDGRRADASSDA